MSDELARKKINFDKSLTTYNLLLDAAEVLIGSKRLIHFSMQDLAKKSGFGVGTIYLYFEDKESLFEALVRRHVFDITQKYHRAILPKLPMQPQEFLYELFLMFLNDEKSKVLSELFSLQSVWVGSKTGPPLFNLLLNILEKEIYESLDIQISEENIEKKSTLFLHLIKGFMNLQTGEIVSAKGHKIFSNNEEYAKWLTDFAIYFLKERV